MSDECPCPQCQEDGLLALQRRLSGQFAEQFVEREALRLKIAAPLRWVSPEVSISESRVFAMLDEDGGWKA